MHRHISQETRSYGRSTSKKERGKIHTKTFAINQVHDHSDDQTIVAMLCSQRGELSEIIHHLSLSSAVLVNDFRTRMSCPVLLSIRDFICRPVTMLGYPLLPKGNTRVVHFNDSSLFVCLSVREGNSKTIAQIYFFAQEDQIRGSFLFKNDPDRDPDSRIY